jgi:hypothetical protein
MDIVAVRKQSHSCTIPVADRVALATTQTQKQGAPAGLTRVKVAVRSWVELVVVDMKPERQSTEPGSEQCFEHYLVEHCKQQVAVYSRNHTIERPPRRQWMAMAAGKP